MSSIARRIMSSGNLTRYYFADDSNTEAPYNNVVLDSSNNIYLVGADGGNATVCKLAPNSLSSIYGTKTTGIALYTKCKLDSSNNLIAAYSNGTNGFIAKFDSSGNVTWSFEITRASGIVSSGLTFDLDSSDNIYVGIYDGSLSYLVKLNSSGVEQWEREVSVTGADSDEITKVFASSSNEIFVILIDNSGKDQSHVLEYNTGGTAQSVFLSVTETDGVTLLDMSEDSSGNFFFAGYNNSGGSADALVVKTNSSGTIQFSKTYGVFTFSSLQIGSSNDIYLMDNALGTKASFIKIENDGTLLWERELTAVSGRIEALSNFEVDSSDNMIIPARYSSDLILFKLPADGSGQQTFSETETGSNFDIATYQSISNTYSDITLSSASGTMASSSTAVISLSSTSTTDSSFTVSFGNIFKF